MKRLLTLLMLLMPALALADDLVLENSRARLVFDGGSQYAIRNFVMEGEDIAAPQSTHPWEIELIGPRGENPLLKPSMAFYDGGTQEGNSLLFRWKLLLEGSTDNVVTMKVTLAPDDELPSFDFSVTLPKGWTVTLAEYPRIAVKRPEGAKVILSSGYGTRYDAPTNGWLRSEYPSCTGGMQLTLMESPLGTVYFSTLDRDASQKVFFIGGEYGGLTFLQKTIASEAWTGEDGVFTLPWAAVMGFTREGWEQTALKWYRPFVLTTRWGEKSVTERDIAPWIRNADVWLRPRFVTPEIKEAVLKGIDYYGKGVGIHWYQWHQIPYDTDYPDYLPAVDGFADIVREVQAKGAHVTPYINGRLWDASNHTYVELGGKDASCRKRDGTLYTEIYGSKVPNTVTCPSSPIWQSILKNLGTRILGELGTDGLYIDQIGAAKGEACYASNHPHALGGGSWWHESYRSLLTEMRRDIFTQGRAVTTEEDAECYIDLFDMMLIVNSPHTAYAEMVPLFPLIYSDRCIYSGFTYIPWTINDGSFDYITMKSLLWGSQLGWITPVDLFKPGNEAQAEFLRTLGKFRKSSHDLFEGGRFMGEFVPGGDNPCKDIPGYQNSALVMGARWLSTDGREAYVVVNMDFESHKVVLPDGRHIQVEARKAKKIWK